MPVRKPETPVIERALRGDQKAFGELMERYHGPLYNLLYKMVRSKEETEDLVQEAFMKAFASLASFNEEFAFSTWLYKIAINNTIDHLRKKRLRTFSIDKPIQSKEGELKREFADVHSSTDHDLLSTEKTGMITCAIEDLPEKYREVILMRHSDELSYEEIAAITKVPLGTVKARIFRAREMLKRKLKDKLTL